MIRNKFQSERIDKLYQQQGFEAMTKRVFRATATTNTTDSLVRTLCVGETNISKENNLQDFDNNDTNQVELPIAIYLRAILTKRKQFEKQNTKSVQNRERSTSLKSSENDSLTRIYERTRKYGQTGAKEFETSERIFDAHQQPERNVISIIVARCARRCCCHTCRRQCIRCCNIDRNRPCRYCRRCRCRCR